MQTGDFAFRLSCYLEFGWTPQQVKALLRETPQEAELLRVRFEETQTHEAQARYDREREQDKVRRTHASGPHTNQTSMGGEWVTDEGDDDDEIDLGQEALEWGAGSEGD